MKSHLSEVNMSYSQHAKRSMKFSVSCFRLGAVCFIHAIIPEVFKTTYSSTVLKMYIEMMEE